MWFKKEKPKSASYEEPSPMDLFKEVRKEVKALEEEKSKLLAQTIALENKVSELETTNNELQRVIDFKERLLNSYRNQCLRMTNNGYGDYLELEKIITTDCNQDNMFITVEGRVTREVYNNLMKRKNTYAILKFLSNGDELDNLVEKEVESCQSKD